MNRYFKIIRDFLPLLVVVAMSACTKAELPVFESQYDSARFPHRREDAPEPNGYDTSKRAFLSSFSFIDVGMPQEYTVSIPLILSGKPSPKERKVTIEDVLDETTAPKDAYKIVSAVIFPDTVAGEVKILLYNRPELKEGSYTLSLKVKDSDDLKAGPDEDIKAFLTWNATIPLPTSPFLIMTYNMLIDSPLRYNSTAADYISTRALEIIAQCFNWYDLNDAKKWGVRANTESVGNYKYLMHSTWVGAGGAQRLYAKQLAEFIDKYNATHPDAPLVHNSGSGAGKPIQARKY